MPFSTITFGGETLNVLEFTSRILVPGTIKQTFSGEITEVRIPGKAKENRISLRGQIRGVNKDTLRTNLKNLDNSKTHDYSDGILNNVKMMIPNGGLVFNDLGGREVGIYDYTLSLIEFNQ